MVPHIHPIRIGNNQQLVKPWAFEGSNSLLVLITKFSFNSLVSVMGQLEYVLVACNNLVGVTSILEQIWAASNSLVGVTSRLSLSGNRDLDVEEEGMMGEDDE